MVGSGFFCAALKIRRPWPLSSALGARRTYGFVELVRDPGRKTRPHIFLARTSPPGQLLCCISGDIGDATSVYFGHGRAKLHETQCCVKKNRCLDRFLFANRFVRGRL